jgi:biotin carboxylase
MKKALLVLEPLNHIYGVVNAAKELGYHIIAIHSMALFAPEPYTGALENIDVAIKTTQWTDYQQLQLLLVEQSQGYEIVGVYTAAEITLIFAAYIQEKLSLVGTPLDTVVKYLNKDLVRKTLKEHQLTDLDCFNVEEIINLEKWPFEGSGFFKPINGSGSANVKEVHNLEQLQQQVNQWEDKSHIFIPVLKDYIEQNNRYFLEESAKGELMSVESLVQNGQVNVLGLSSRSLLKRDMAVEMGACFPYQHPLSEQIIAKVKAFHQVLGITNGPTHTEVMVDDNGHIELVEMNLRFAGADTMLITGMALETSVAKLLVKLAVNAPIDVQTLKTTRFASMQFFLAPQNMLTFDSVSFSDTVEFTRVMKAAGSKLTSTDNQIDHIAGFLISADSYEVLLESIKEARKKTQVNQHSLAGDINNQVFIR